MLKSDMTRVVLAAELSTRPQMRGYPANSEAMLHLANEWMYKREGFQMRASVDDARVIANAVFYAIRPEIHKLLRPLCDASITDQHIELMIDRVFHDDDPRRIDSRYL